MGVQDFPTLNVTLNITTTILLSAGFIAIKLGDKDVHRRLMLGALACSACFLSSYVVYHIQVGSVKYPYTDWTRPIYFAILIPHVILAALLVPLVIVLVVHARRGNFTRHKRLARWIWPIWMVVSVSGTIVYFMLYRL